MAAAPQARTEQALHGDNRYRIVERWKIILCSGLHLFWKRYFLCVNRVKDIPDQRIYHHGIQAKLYDASAGRSVSRLIRNQSLIGQRIRYVGTWIDINRNVNVNILIKSANSTSFFMVIALFPYLLPFTRWLLSKSEWLWPWLSQWFQITSNAHIGLHTWWQ